MKKLFFLSFVFCLLIGSIYGYKTHRLYQEKNTSYFLFDSKTNIFQDNYLVFSSIYDFFKLLHIKKESQNVTQKHICLFQDEIFKQNKIWRPFNQNKLESTLKKECQKQMLFYNNQPVWEFNGWLCSHHECHLTSFYYGDYIVLEKKQVLKKENNKLTEVEYNHFIKKTFEIENAKKSTIIHSSNSLGIGNQLFQFWGNYIWALKKEKSLFFVTELKVLKIFQLPKIEILPKKHKFKFKKAHLARVIPLEKDYPLLINNPISVKNLKGYETFIQENTKFKSVLTDKSKEISLQMQNEPSVSLHIRRGDFITENYKVLNLSYYDNAIQYIKERLKNPHFYVFSDDISWAKENLKTDEKVTFVDWTTSAEEDLHLMTKTKHNIIANSSFSWWGAFLNKNKEKIVIIPETGFYNEGWEHMKVNDNWIVIQE